LKSYGYLSFYSFTPPWQSAWRLIRKWKEKGRINLCHRQEDSVLALGIGIKTKTKSKQRKSNIKSPKTKTNGKYCKLILCFILYAKRRKSLLFLYHLSSSSNSLTFLFNLIFPWAVIMNSLIYYKNRNLKKQEIEVYSSRLNRNIIEFTIFPFPFYFALFLRDFTANTFFMAK